MQCTTVKWQVTQRELHAYLADAQDSKDQHPESRHSLQSLGQAQAQGPALVQQIQLGAVAEAAACSASGGAHAAALQASKV